VRVKGDDAAAGVVATPAVNAHAIANQAGRAGRQGLDSPPLVRQPHADVAVVRRLGALEAEKPANLGRDCVTDCVTALGPNLVAVVLGWGTQRLKGASAPPQNYGRRLELI
jgi:hypothetical protein